MTPRPRNHALIRAETPRANHIDPRGFSVNKSNRIVYFIRYATASDVWIRIGESQAMKRRWATHSLEAARGGQSIWLVAAVNGTALEEGRVHEYFKAYRRTNPLPNKRQDLDTFDAAPELCDYIRWLRDQYTTAVGEDHRDGCVGEVEAIDYEYWGPTAARTKPWVPDLLIKENDFGPRVLTGDDYYTAPELIALVRTAFGGQIDLDPASHAVANGTIQATRIFTKAEDGRQQQWAGRVWLNPPFSLWADFAAKVLRELDRGEIDVLMTLLSAPAITTQYVRPLLQRLDALIIPTGRMTAWGPMASDAPTGHLLLAFTPKREFLSAIRRTFNAGFTVLAPLSLDTDIPLFVDVPKGD